MHVCIMSSLLQQVEESIGLFISGARPARNGRLGAFCPHPAAHAHGANRPAGIFCFVFVI